MLTNQSTAFFTGFSSAMPVRDVDSFIHAGKHIRLIPGSIVEIDADALVSSDDNYLTMSGGVSAALRHAAGEGVHQEAQTHAPAQIGSVVVTSAGMIETKYIFHAIVIDFDAYQWPDITIIREATANCLREADKRECRSIALPALGTGAGLVASQAAAEIMLETIFELAPTLKFVEEIIVVPYRQDTLIEFLRYGILNRVQTQYGARLAELQQASALLADQLRQESPYRDIPFPIAVGRRMIDVFSNPHSQFTASLDCAEAILRYCGTLAAANHCRTNKEQLPQILEEFRRGMSMGSWGNLVERYVPKKQKYNGGTQDFAVAEPLHEFYWRNQQRFTRLIELRNKHKGHGATHNPSEYQALFQQVMTELEPLIEEIKWTARFPLIYVESACIGEEESEDNYVYDVQRVTGDNILFRRDTIRSQHLRLTNGKLYLLSTDANTALGLSPFLVFASCPLCQTQETFFLEAVDEKAHKLYHTFRSNHRWSE